MAPAYSSTISSSGTDTDDQALEPQWSGISSFSTAIGIYSAKFIGDESAAEFYAGTAPPSPAPPSPGTFPGNQSTSPWLRSPSFTVAAAVDADDDSSLCFVGSVGYHELWVRAI